MKNRKMGFINMTKEQERTELHRTIWPITKLLTSIDHLRLGDYSDNTIDAVVADLKRT